MIMEDAPLPVAIVPTMDVEDSDPLALESALSEFVPSRTIFAPGGKKYMVPSTAKSNRHASQMIVSKIRCLLDKKIDELTESMIPLDVRVIKDLTSAAAQLHVMSMDAYGGGKPPVNEGQVSAFEKMATDMVEAAAKGTAAALNDGFEAKLQKIKNLGRATKPVEPVIIDEPEPSAAPANP